MNTSLKSYFLIRGDFNKEEVTNFLNIIPNESWNRGEKNKDQCLPRTSIICIGETKEEGKNIDGYQVADAVISSICDKIESLNLAKEKWNLEYTLQMVLKIGQDEAPAIGLSEEVIRFLGSIKGNFDLDSYILQDLGEPVAGGDATR